MSDEKPRYANYIPHFFETDSEDRARQLILTDNDTMTGAERWEHETNFLCEAIGRELNPQTTDVILDFGCGIGRVAKAVIERFGCRVIGLDISASMRKMALEYVQSINFSAVSPDEFDALVRGRVQISHCYAIWVLQHVVDPRAELVRIKEGLKQSGRFYFVNEPGRCVPCDLGWVNDGLDILKIIPDFGLRVVKEDRIALYPTNRDPLQWPIANTYVREGQ
jgi:SAM-dependent methyltransferase